jgi:hypothetical protein
MSNTIALLLNTNVLKVVALLLAYFYWSLLSDTYPIDTRLQLPVTISTHKMQVLQAPSSALVTLRGLRKYIRALDTSALAITIPESELLPGNNLIALTNKHLSLPPAITLANYSPLNFVVGTNAMETSQTL